MPSVGSSQALLPGGIEGPFCSQPAPPALKAGLALAEPRCGLQALLLPGCLPQKGNKLGHPYYCCPCWASTPQLSFLSLANVLDSK